MIMVVTGYTAIFLESKNFEVKPLGLTDITDFFLAKYGKVSTEDIVYVESLLRQHSNFENESATLFDSLSWFIKAWKFQCQVEFTRLKPAQSSPCLEAVYSLIQEVEMMAYDYSKSLLIDCDSMQYRPSLIMAAVITGSIQLQLAVNFTYQKISNNSSLKSFVLMDIKIAN